MSDWYTRYMCQSATIKSLCNKCEEYFASRSKNGKLWLLIKIYMMNGVVDKLCCNISIWNLICFGLVLVSRCIGECTLCNKLKKQISIQRDKNGNLCNSISSELNWDGFFPSPCSDSLRRWHYVRKDHCTVSVYRLIKRFPSGISNVGDSAANKAQPEALVPRYDALSQSRSHQLLHRRAVELDAD